MFCVLTHLLQTVLNSRFHFYGRRQTKASQKWGPGSWILKDGQGFGREKCTLKREGVSKAVVAEGQERSHFRKIPLGLRLGGSWEGVGPALPCPIHARRSSERAVLCLVHSVKPGA